MVTGLPVIVIDGTIAGVSLPTVSASLDQDPNQTQWVDSPDSFMLDEPLPGGHLAAGCGSWQASPPATRRWVTRVLWNP